MKYVQCNLRSDDSRITAWLEDKIKVGDLVTLKDSEEPERWWKILSKGEPKDRSEYQDSHGSKKWHKNDFHGRLKGLQNG